MWWLLALTANVSADADSLRIVEHIDPLNDSKSVYAVVGNADQHLAVGCDNINERSVRVVAHFNRYIGDAQPGILAGGTQLQYRFDRRPPVTVFWYSHDREVTAEAEITRPIRFILDMKLSTSVYLRATDHDGDSFDMNFTYEDATPIIEEMLVACGLNTDGSKRKK